MAIETSTKNEFERAIQPYLTVLKRDLPWRRLAENRDLRFYQVLVSEMMLQQTQVVRVIEKYNLWMRKLPNIASTAAYTKGDFIKLWQGLGYNRRAGYLFDIVRDLRGAEVPKELSELSVFKGIGKNTAGAIAVYCDNKPLVFVETNTRTVIIHHFYKNKDNVSDAQIESTLAELLPTHNPRIWYWALMDYGTELKQQKLGKIQNSLHYRKQSNFKGSRRELRGKVIKAVIENEAMGRKVLHEKFNDERLDQIIEDLIADNLLQFKDRKLVLP